MINQAQLLASLQRVQTLHQSGRTAEAWTAIAPLRSAIDSHGQALRLFALVAQAAGQIDPAVGAMHRILTIEREPPDIVGALADMFGTAGRHDEALAQWTRLTVLLPANVDAHLNRAIAASKADKHLIAIEAADAGLKLDPAHAPLMSVRAMALNKAGRVEEAVAAFDQAVAADPSRALTRYNQAVTLRVAYRFDDADAAFAESRRLGLSGAALHCEWAATALQAGRIDRAIALYETALAAEPGHDEAMRALSHMHTTYRTGRDPFGHYASFAAAAPQSTGSWLAWANALAAARDYDQAADVASRGLAAHPDDAVLQIVRSFCLGMAGEAGGPADDLENWVRLMPDDPLLAGMLSQIGLRAGRPEVAARAAERLIAGDPYHQTAWAILSLAWRVMDDPREQWLCDYDRLVMTVPVSPPDDALSPLDYASAVAEMLRPLHVSLEAPGDQSLRHGTQTAGALFDNPDAAIQRFRQSISAVAARAVGHLPGDPAHPFLSRKAIDFRFNGSWSVRLRAGGGHHVPHFHSEGWMSSAYYAHLPAHAPESDPRQGWIEFGRSPPVFKLDLPPRRVVEPKPGLLVLFPSYLWHGTIPFDAGERLTAAFDFLPAGRSG